MHVGAAGLDSDLPEDGDARRAHALVFLVRQGERRGDGDGIAGVHAHRVHVLDGADDDRVVGPVAHHLHLELLPAEEGLVDQDLPHRGGFHARAADGAVLVAVVGDAAAGAAHGEGGADDGGQADLLDGGHRGGHPGGDVALAGGQFRRGDDGGAGVFQPDAGHRLAEEAAVLGHLDRFAPGADHLDAASRQHPHLLDRERGVEAGLAAHGGQERVGALDLDDPGDDLGGDGLDIGGVGQRGVGHDRGRVRVDEDDAVALLAQRLAGLRSGIVELAGLPDDDGSGTDDHDRLDVGALRHGSPSRPGAGRSSGLIGAGRDGGNLGLP